MANSDSDYGSCGTKRGMLRQEGDIKVYKITKH